MTLTNRRSGRPLPHRMIKTFPANAFTALLCVVMSLAAACGSSETPSASEAPPADEAQRYAIHGKVVKLEPENQAATIEHDEIVGWMDAMTMRFPIKEQADWEKLTEGAEINGTVFVSSDGFYVGDVEVVSSEDSDGEGQQEQD